MAGNATPMSAEFQEAVRREGMKPDTIEVCGFAMRDQCGIITVPEYVGFFGAKEQYLIDFWAAQHQWTGKGAILAYLRLALGKLQAVASRALTEKSTLLDTDLDNPIDPPSNGRDGPD